MERASDKSRRDALVPQHLRTMMIPSKTSQNWTTVAFSKGSQVLLCPGYVNKSRNSCNLVQLFNC